MRETRPGPAPRNDAWKVIGPGGGGGQFDPNISPHDPNVVIERCDMTGAYLSYDGGLSWRMFNLNGVLAASAFDPNDPNVIYGGNAGLYRSENKGKTWSLIFPNPTRNTVAHTCNDHADYRITSDDPDFPSGRLRVQAIAVAPGDSGHLMLAAAGRPASLLESTNRGASWRRARELEEGPVLALRLTRAGGELHTLAVQPTAVFVRHGDTWERRPGPEGVTFRAVAIGEEQARVILYVIGGGTGRPDIVRAAALYISEDMGRTWRAGEESIAALRLPESDPPTLTSVGCSAQHAATAYLGFDRLRTGEGPENLFCGILKTTDAGRTWQFVHRESNRASDNLVASYIELRCPDGRPNIWFAAPFCLGIAPTDPGICYATDYFRTIQTKDGGKTWRSAYSVKVGKEAWTTTGLDVTTCYGVHFDPFDKDHLFISYTDIGLFQSRDGGHSWIPSAEGIPPRWINTAYWMVFDPKVKDLLWAVFSGYHDLPRTKMWRHTDPKNYKGGVGISADGGRTWTLLTNGITETAATDIVLDPTSPVGSRTLYVAGFGTGVWKSTDGGKSWVLKKEGIEGDEPFAWRMTRAEDGTLYLAVARRAFDEHSNYGTPEDGALYRSRDGAETWERITLPEGCNGPNDIKVDPRDPNRLYLAAWGRFNPPDDSEGGVFRSTDGGATWENVFKISQHAYDVTIDPKNPDTVYVCGFDSAAYRSTDGGDTWRRLKGYNFKWGHRVVIDPHHEGMIYITTFGGSVWHGPAAGDPNAVEDIATPIPMGTEV